MAPKDKAHARSVAVGKDGQREYARFVCQYYGLDPKFYASWTQNHPDVIFRLGTPVDAEHSEVKKWQIEWDPKAWIRQVEDDVRPEKRWHIAIKRTQPYMKLHDPWYLLMNEQALRMLLREAAAMRFSRGEKVPGASAGPYRAAGMRVVEQTQHSNWSLVKWLIDTERSDPLDRPFVIRCFYRQKAYAVVSAYVVLKALADVAGWEKAEEGK